ncbi:MAG: DinB family protein [Anaerolineae bacterium]|nr:DinB family protein [Anaerolineae bacterium]
MTTPRVESLLAKLEKGHRKTLEIFAALNPAQWAQVVYDTPHVWRARELLAHFVSSEEALLKVAQDVAAGGPGAPPDFDYDAFNAQEQERLKGHSPEELLAALDRARRATLDWVRTLDDATLDRVGRHPALGDVTLETMITAIYGHQLLHMQDLRDRLAPQS